MDITHKTRSQQLNFECLISRSKSYNLEYRLNNSLDQYYIQTSIQQIYENLFSVEYIVVIRPGRAQTINCKLHPDIA